MASKTVTYPVCDKCNKTLVNESDGVVVFGRIYAGGPQGAEAKLLIGSKPGIRDGGSIEHVRCWSCFNKEAPNPALAEAERRAQADRDRDDRLYQHDDDQRGSRQGPTGPCDPPDLPARAIRPMGFLLPYGLRRR